MSRGKISVEFSETEDPKVSFEGKIDAVDITHAKYHISYAYMAEYTIRERTKELANVEQKRKIAERERAKEKVTKLQGIIKELESKKKAFEARSKASEDAEEQILLRKNLNHLNSGLEEAKSDLAAAKKVAPSSDPSSSK